MGMNDVNSLSHTKWNCKYHIPNHSSVHMESIYSYETLAVYIPIED